MLNFINLLLESDATGEEGKSGESNIFLFIVLGVLVVAVIAVFIFSNINKRKQQKESEKQKSALKPGDLIETVGGIIGKIVLIRPSANGGTEFVIETGEPDRATTLTVDMQALYRVFTKTPEPTADVKPAISKPDVDGLSSAPVKQKSDDTVETEQADQKKTQK